MAGEVAVHLPGAAKVGRALDQHGCWPEGLEQRSRTGGGGGGVFTLSVLHLSCVYNLTFVSP